MRRISLFYCLLSASFPFFYSCVDNNYDLSKNVDLTISVGGDLSIPGCNTEEITLKNVFDLDESDPDNVIKADVDGWYSLLKAGVGSETTINVETVPVKEMEAEEIVTELKFQKAELDAVGRAEFEIEADYSAFSFSDESVTKDIVSVKYADPDAEIPIDAKMYFDPLNNTVSALHLAEGFSIYIPKFLDCRVNTEVLGAEAGDYELVELGANTTDVRDVKYKDNYNKLVFLKDKKLQKDNMIRVPILVKRLLFDHFQDGQGILEVPNAEYNRLFVKDNLILSGTVYLNAADQEATASTITMHLHTPIVAGNQDSDVKFSLKSIMGIVDPKVDISVDAVAFSNLPSFLSDEQVVMDLTNPKLLLTVTNTSPVDVNIYADLVAMKDDVKTTEVGIGKGPEANGVKHETDPILIKANGTSVICLSRLGEGAPEGGINVMVPLLGDLIKKVPDQISIDNVVAKVLQKDYEIELGVSYQVETDYNVDTPLAFGKDLSIIYNDSVGDWNTDINKEDLEVKAVNVKLDALNKIPLNMKFIVTPVDVDGNVIPDITVEQPMDIKPGNGLLGNESGMVATQLSIKLRTEKEGAMRRLDGLHFRVEGTNAGFEEYQGVQLNQNQTLKLDNIRIEVPGGVKMNLN